MGKVLVIFRGLPGSGKSFTASLFFGNDNICSADDYFIRDGVYKFNQFELKKAHKYCIEKARNLMMSGIDKIAISNTNTTEKELAPYFKMAEEYGYSVISLVVENRHGNSNVHGVPADKLVAMKERFNIKL